MHNGLEALQIERQRPAQINAAMAANPIVYVPLGTYEFHGAHLPIGLDSLAAHRLCLEVAQRVGGLVCPPLYYGWGNNGYPWNIMTHDEAALASLLNLTLSRLQEMNVRLAVLFSGHFQTEQLTLLQAIAADWNAGGHTMRALALSVKDCPDPPLPPDHAALFETSLLAAFAPDLVDLEQLPDIETRPANDPQGNSWGAHRGNPTHPLYGIFGEDPRRYQASRARQLAGALITWLAGEVEGNGPDRDR